VAIVDGVEGAVESSEERGFDDAGESELKK
jgi:hypothetical protein